MVVIGKLVVLGQKWLYSGKSGSICGKEVVFGEMVVFGLTWLYSGNWLYWGKSGCTQARMVVMWKGGCICVLCLYLAKSGCIREKISCFLVKVVVFNKSCCIGAKRLYSG